MSEENKETYLEGLRFALRKIIERQNELKTLSPFYTKMLATELNVLTLRLIDEIQRVQEHD